VSKRNRRSPGSSSRSSIPARDHGTRRAALSSPVVRQNATLSVPPGASRSASARTSAARAASPGTWWITPNMPIRSNGPRGMS